MSHPHAAQLQALMAQANVSDVIQLAAYSQVPARQLYRLQVGLIHSIPVESVVQLAQYFDQSVDEFLAQFLPTGIHPMAFAPKTNPEAAIAPAALEALKTEKETLQAQLETQAINHAEEIEQLQHHLETQANETAPQVSQLETKLETQAINHAKEIEQLQQHLTTQVQNHEQTIEDLKCEYQRLDSQLNKKNILAEQQWQQEALNILESWLLQWPSAAQAAQDNPHFPANTLIALTQPFEQLLDSWGISAIGTVGEVIPYDPQAHQLVKNYRYIRQGDPVLIQNSGYRQGDRLLHRAKVIYQEEPAMQTSGFD